MGAMRSVFALYLLLGSFTPGMAQTSIETNVQSAMETSTLSQSLVREAKAAIDSGARWLISSQYGDGHWSNPDFPGLTGLSVATLVAAGYQDHEAVKKGVNYILSCVREDGSIWKTPGEKRKGGGLPNYNTAICMVALHAAGDQELDSTVQRAREYMAGSQHLGGDEYHGGAGYDPATGRPYADLSNSYMMYEAIRLTESLRDLRQQEVKADLDWRAAEEFIAQLQNPDGGFIYKPGESKAGSFTNETGEIRFRSYGSMTYAGLLSLIYATANKHDPRVQSALDWAKTHWSLKENPGMGAEGLYYFYNVLAKALHVAGEGTFQAPSGRKISWRKELIRELLNRQKIEKNGTGYWQNEASRWMEADKVLVTSYAVTALQMSLGLHDSGY